MEGVAAAFLLQFSICDALSFGDPQWIPVGGAYGMNDVVFSIASDSASNVYAGGAFTMAASSDASHIARWNTADRQWYPLGEGVNGHVHAVEVSPDGMVYASGDFTSAGGTGALNIAVWNPGTEQWAPLSDGLDGEVNAIAFDAEGRVYAGGYFTHAGGHPANRIAMWNPVSSAWTNLGSGLNDGVYALCVDSNGLVYAGGVFTLAGGTPASYVACWDGSGWTNLGAGTDGFVSSLVTGPSNTIYVGGSFDAAGAVTSKAAAAWHPATGWSSMTMGLSCFVLSLDYDAGADQLYAVGWITCASSSSASTLARRDGDHWTAIATLNDMSTAVASAPGGLYVGGYFTEIDQVRNCQHIAFIDDQGPHPMGRGMENVVDALAADESGAVYAGGWFHEAGEQSNCHHVARYDAETDNWSCLGEGMNDGVYALTVSTSGHVFAGGAFHAAEGNTNCRHIARWDAASGVWTNLGSGIDGHVHTLAAGENGEVYAGGNFTTAGGITAAHVAVWNGVSWAGLGGGIPGEGPVYAVNAIAVDSSNAVYVGGWFTNSGGVRSANIAKWDPSLQSWTNLGLGISDLQEVYAIAVDGSGIVYAGGCFTNAGGTGVSHIARWDPATAVWSAMGGGVNCRVHAILPGSDGRVYAGGQFTSADGEPAYGLAVWDGAGWRAVGSGLDGPVYALVEGPRGLLFAGGDFRKAGRRNSAYMGLALLDHADSDDDSLPDWWELMYYAGRTNAAPSQIISNGVDSVRDAYLADIDPLDPGSMMPLAGMVPGLPQLTVYPASTARVYRLYSATDLTASPQIWTLREVRQPAGGDTAVTFDLPDDSASAVFRTSVGLPP